MENQDSIYMEYDARKLSVEEIKRSIGYLMARRLDDHIMSMADEMELRPEKKLSLSKEESDILVNIQMQLQGKTISPLLQHEINNEVNMHVDPNVIAKVSGNRIALYIELEVIEVRENGMVRVRDSEGADQLILSAWAKTIGLVNIGDKCQFGTLPVVRAGVDNAKPGETILVSTPDGQNNWFRNRYLGTPPSPQS